MFRRKKRHLNGMGTFRRGLTISPFQIPLLVYLAFEGLILCLNADSLGSQLDVPDWSVVNLGLALLVGGVLATVSRFNENERLETFGLLLILLGIFIAVGISVVAHDYNLGDEVAIGLGCVLRVRVLSKSRRAERLATKISGEINGSNDDGERP